MLPTLPQNWKSKIKIAGVLSYWVTESAGTDSDVTVLSHFSSFIFMKIKCSLEIKNPVLQ